MPNGEGEGEAHYDDAQLSWTALSFLAQFLSSALFSKLSEAKLFPTTGGEERPKRYNELKNFKIRWAPSRGSTAHRCAQHCPECHSWTSHSHTKIFYSSPADSPQSEKELPYGQVCILTG